MKRILMAAMLVGLLGAACTAGPAEPVVTPAVKKTDGIPRSPWEQRWETVLAAARKEGVVRLYSQWGPETRNLLSQGLKEKYGIELEVVPFARGADLVAKIQAEKRAGLYLADIIGIGATTLLASMKPEGLLQPVGPFLILPEVTDPKLWLGGQFPFVDKDGTAVGMISALQRYIAYNTTLVKDGEITTYKDLLKPQYKGKIVMGDPSIAGAPNAWFTNLAHRLWNLEEAKDYLRKLIVQQDAVVLRDHSLVIEWVARGRYSIGLAGFREAVTRFVELGAPISLVTQAEGHGMSTSSGGLGVAATPAHPNAVIVFVNWILSREGATAFSGSLGSPSTRADVPPENINPLFLPKPGEKLYMQSEEEVLFAGKMTEEARKVVEETLKK
ncbi:MAG: extracellular solute-binding protein [Chloroflexi bacterium]|nr:extracellular solute-binding protein [Chloroflexota bacterium]